LRLTHEFVQSRGVLGGEWLGGVRLSRCIEDDGVGVAFEVEGAL
jgi:hypothetical protein